MRGINIGSTTAMSDCNFVAESVNCTGMG